MTKRLISNTTVDKMGGKEGGHAVSAAISLKYHKGLDSMSSADSIVHISISISINSMGKVAYSLSRNVKHEACRQHFLIQEWFLISRIIVV